MVKKNGHGRRVWSAGVTLAPGSGCAVALLTAGRPCAGLRFQRVRERGGNVCFGVAWGRTRSRVSTRKEPPGEQFQRPPHGVAWQLACRFG